MIPERLRPHREELGALGVALVAVAGTWGFVALAGFVVAGDTQGLDEWALAALRDPADPARPRGPAWLAKAAADATALGGYTVVALVTLAVVGYLLLSRHYRTTAMVLAAAAGGGLVNHLLKAVFGRARPEIVPHLTTVGSPSFPSGHAMLSAAVYLALAVLLARILRRRWAKIYVVSVGLATTGVVGFTRVYLGVHYPSDVLGGWLAGIAWALACGTASELLYRRLRREPERDRRPSSVR